VIFVGFTFISIIEPEKNQGYNEEEDVWPDK
jgi:hypothetical protein